MNIFNYNGLDAAYCSLYPLHFSPSFSGPSRGFPPIRKPLKASSQFLNPNSPSISLESPKLGAPSTPSRQTMHWLAPQAIHLHVKVSFGKKSLM
ncbi:hypothetical protein PSPTOT1_5661 [Pseudomonas syringae pv. tomato T1]|nr:hypothetical protein PSPTOT1_5661 [Pseudomonas syringae pv. tomato T1]